MSFDLASSRSSATVLVDKSTFSAFLVVALASTAFLGSFVSFTSFLVSVFSAFSSF